VFDSGARRSRGSTARGVLATLLTVLAVGAVVGALTVGSLDVAGAWRDALDDRDFLNRLIFSLAQAAAATAIGLALGLPASWFLSRGSLPLRGLFVLLIAAPLAIPGVVVGMGVVLIASGEIVPRALVVFAHVIFTTATVAWLVTPAWASGDRQATEDARLLGAGRLRAYFVGTGRYVPSAVRLSVALAFWYAFAAAATVAIVGGDAATTESALAFGDPVSFVRPQAEGAFGAQQSVLAIVQLLVGVGIFAFGGMRWPRMATVRPRAGRGTILVGLTYLLALGAGLWAPFAWVVNEAAVRGDLAALLDASVGGRGVVSLLTWTGVLAALSASGATAAAWLASGVRSREGSGRGDAFARWSVALPAALTGAAIGWAGLGIAREVGIDLERTYLLTVVAHALLGYPFALRILATRRQPRSVLLEDALVLGVPERAVRWRWMGRRTLMALVSAFLVAMTLSAGEVAATALLTPANAMPGSLGLLRGWVDAGGSTGGVVPGEVYALGAALATVTVIAFACAEWLRRAAVRVEAG